MERDQDEPGTFDPGRPKDSADSLEAQAALRRLPSVDALLQHALIAPLLGEHPRPEVLAAIRQTLDHVRERIRAGTGSGDRMTVTQRLPDLADLALATRQRLYQRALPHLRPVINATGIVLHTGLGRAPLAPEAIEAITGAAAGYCNLEFDLATGRRGDRHDHLRDLLCELTGAQDAVVVNNNAAGTLLALNTCAAGQEAIVSRGQLVEIGGSFRMPAIMAAAGCRLVEVGTTNRTHVTDYRRAVTAATRVLLRVHTSNYRIEGFASSPSIEALVKLAQEFDRDRPTVVDDLGSGLLDAAIAPAAEPGAGPSEAAGDEEVELRQSPAWDEPSVRDSIRAGADLVLFSGDKLLGGPQAGIIVGRAAQVARLRTNPLMRTYRPDKLTLAGLEATLRLYRDPERLIERLPALRMLHTPLAQLEATARRMAALIQQLVPACRAVCMRAAGFAGGGTLPTVRFETWVVRVCHPEIESAALAAALRGCAEPVVGRLKNGELLLDCRTLLAGQAERIPPRLAECARELSSGPHPC